MRKAAIAALLLWAVGAGAAGAAAPRRIVSLNLCADQYLVALADPGQVAGLTRLARDPAMSAAAAIARRYPVAGSGAEVLLALQPDLVLAGWPGQADVARRLGLRARVLVMPPAKDYADIVAQTRAVAAAVGHADRGEALVRRMDAALASIPRLGRGRVAADYQRRGFLTGQGTLMDDMMRRAGLTNLAARLGRPALSQLPLELLVAARPDYLIVGGSRPARDLGSAMQGHPALTGIARLYLPGAFTSCGGPSFPAAVRLLADQLGR